MSSILACDVGSFKGNPEDCNSYYECIGNDWQLMHCAEGLEWNQEANVCDYPENAHCQETTETTTENTETTTDTTPSSTTDSTTTTDTTPSSTTDSTTITDTTATTTDSTSTVCSSSTTVATIDCKCPPKDDPEHDVLCKNPVDCSTFYKCFEGEPRLIKCPPEQEWAEEYHRCDWPEVANCHQIC